jgi:galactose mutarotase-like enzyme
MFVPFDPGSVGGMDIHAIDSGELRAEISPVGAELQSLRLAAGSELLWQGAAPWARRAPILFPIIGRMPEDELQHEGHRYPIGQHGVVRDKHFEVEPVSPHEVLFSLESDEETLTHFPFTFRLEVRYRLDGRRLDVEQRVTNTGEEPFSASLGAHPGFAWPLLPGIARDQHSIVFAEPEPDPIRRLADGMLLPGPQPSPVDGDILRLRDELFAPDALVFDAPRSRSVRYSAPGAPAITVDFPDFPQLGIWSRAPGEFVCIEPWFGFTAPQGFTGDYADKPGQFRLEPSAARTFAYGIRIDLPE